MSCPGGCGGNSVNDRARLAQLRQAAKAGVVAPQRVATNNPNPFDPRGVYHPAFGFVRPYKGTA